MITYGEDIQNLYNMLVKRDPMHFLKKYASKTLEAPLSTAWLLMCHRRGKSYPVSSVSAHGKFREKVLSIDDLSKPVSDFVPRAYHLKSAELHDGIFFRSWSWDHSGSNFEKVPLLRNREVTLEEQVRKLKEAK